MHNFNLYYHIEKSSNMAKIEEKPCAFGLPLIYLSKEPVVCMNRTQFEVRDSWRVRSLILVDDR